MTSTSPDGLVDHIPQVCARCGHPELTERSRQRLHQRIEQVVYIKQRIKHFNREGSEFWTDMEIPDLVETDVEVDEFEVACGACGHVQRARVRVAA
ncbi:MAG: hypothetical protein EA406_04200 [Rhodospirillales bacterium]|nr:MAG: hypothetical protein EA406_04200 [Rhodospirillales bacterium]